MVTEENIQYSLDNITAHYWTYESLEGAESRPTKSQRGRRGGATLGAAPSAPPSTFRRGAAAPLPPPPSGSPGFTFTLF